MRFQKKIDIFESILPKNADRALADHTHKYPGIVKYPNILVYLQFSIC